MNIYIEHFEVFTLRTAENAPMLWKQYVGNTFVIQCIEPKENCLQHINIIDQAIKFTVQDTRADCSKPFLDTVDVLTKCKYPT